MRLTIRKTFVAKGHALNKRVAAGRYKISRDSRREESQDGLNLDCHVFASVTSKPARSTTGRLSYGAAADCDAGGIGIIQASHRILRNLLNGSHARVTGDRLSRDRIPSGLANRILNGFPDPIEATQID